MPGRSCWPTPFSGVFPYIFLELLAGPRCFMQLREDTHFYATLPLPVIRRTALELGRRLVSAGVGETPADIFQLKLDELKKVGGTWPPPPQLVSELRGLVLRRQQQRAALAGKPLIDPRFFRQPEPGRGDDGSGVNVLTHGTPGSPGG